MSYVLSLFILGMSISLCCMSILRNGRVAVSTLGVKGHLIGGFEGGGGSGGYHIPSYPSQSLLFVLPSFKTAITYYWWEPLGQFTSIFELKFSNHCDLSAISMRIETHRQEASIMKPKFTSEMNFLGTIMMCGNKLW